MSEAERKRIFDDFYKLANHDSQNKYLYGLVKRLVPKQRRPRSGTANKTPRRNSFKYHVRLSSGDHVKVCKLAFCQIHSIGKCRVENVCEKIAAGVLFSGDERGKHDNRPHSTSEELKVQIRAHISSFPCQESHYSRSDNRKRKYLPENLSIARMHRLYLAKYEPDLAESEKPHKKPHK